MKKIAKLLKNNSNIMINENFDLYIKDLKINDIELKSEKDAAKYLVAAYKGAAWANAEGDCLEWNNGEKQ